MTHLGIDAVLPSVLRQPWRDLRSIYYTNTPTWRWLKSGALVFLGLFTWMGGSVLRSVQPGWGFLTYVMAYGFLVIVWGPLTHFLVVPMTIRIRRTAEGSVETWLSRHSGKLNLTVFFALVVVLGTLAPAVMVLEFSPEFGSDGGTEVRGDLRCDFGDEQVTCQVENAVGIDHVTVESGGEQLARADDPPFNLTFDPEDVAETRRGTEFQVTYRDADGNRIRRTVRRVR